MRIHNLYTDANGQSHFRDIEVDWVEETRSGKLSKRLPATGIIFREVPPTYDLDWHPAPRRQYIINLDAGVEIHEYQPSFLHAKVAVIDGRWATVGSSNIDPVSLLLAREANVVVESEAFARELRDSLQAAIASGAKPVAREYAEKMSLTTRLMTWIAYGMLRTLTGISSYGRARDSL